MQADTVQLDGRAVDQQSAIRGECQVAEADVLPDNLIAQHGLQRVNVRRVRRPELRRKHLHDRLGLVARGFHRHIAHRHVAVEQHMCQHAVVLHAAKLRVNGYRPAFQLVRGCDVHAVQRNMALGQHMQRHVAVDARAGIPAAVRALMADMHRQRVSADEQPAGQVHVERRVAVMMRADDVPVEQHVAVHIHAVEPHEDARRAPAFRHVQRAQIPRIRRLVQVIFVFNQKIMGQIDCLKCRIAHIFQRRAERQLAELPAIVEQLFHGHPSIV